MPFRKVAIIGLGLIGGSLGLVLKKRFRGIEVMAISRSSAKIQLAVRRKAIDRGSTKPDKILPFADLIIICTPVSSIPSWITLAEKFAKPGTHVTDVGSTKAALIRWAERKKTHNIRFVGSHPMAGSHQSGMEYAQDSLFDGSLTFVTKTPKTDPAALKKITAFWKRISKRICVLSPSAHDKIVSEISHAPHALAAMMVLTAAPLSLPFAASGFLDTTRVAQGDPGLWRDIFEANRHFVLKNLKEKKRHLDRFIGFLAKNDTQAVHRWLQKASLTRRRLGHSIRG